MAMDLINRLDVMPCDDIIKWVLQCQDETTGGFAGNVGHDTHLLYTLSAIQILAIFEQLDKIDKKKVATCQSHNQHINTCRCSPSFLCAHSFLLVFAVCVCVV